MSKTFADVVEMLQKTSERIDSVEKSIVHLRAGETAQTVIKKVLSDGRGGAAATIGLEGDTTLCVLRSITGTRQKSIGIGEFLTNVAFAGGNFAGVDRGRVEKNLSGMGSKIVTKTALAEGSGVTGGYTVPVQFYMELMRLVAEESFTRQRCMVLPMQSRTLLVPALLQSGAPAAGTSGFFAGIQASWQPEGQTINQSQPNFRQIELTARDLVFTCVASNQLLQDNAVALDTLLTTLFKEAMAWFFDYYTLRGNGSNQPLGILNAPATLSGGGGTSLAQRVSPNHVLLDDVAGMLAHLLPSSWGTACWIAHPSVIFELMRMTDNATSGTASGRLVWLNNAPASGGNAGGVAQAPVMMLAGLPVIISEKVPQVGTKGDLMLIDFSKQLVGDRLAVQIEASPHVLFPQNQLMWRIIQRWDSQPWLDGAVILADGGQNYKVSPFIALN